MHELSLVPDLVLPHKFKMPEFEKFDGTSDPLAHLRMFARMMTGYLTDDKLSIHSFQASLSGSAKRWYNQLSRSDIQSWRHLAHAFLEQYKHVLDMAPDRLSLQYLEKKPFESFRQYAQRWKNMASEVQPPLTEKEIKMIFISTLRSPYYERLIGSGIRNFSGLMLSGELIEDAVRSGKIETSDKQEVHVIHNSGLRISSNSYPNHHDTPYSRAMSTQDQTKRKSRRERRKQMRRFTPIPMLYRELYPKLLQDNLITPGEAPVLNMKGDKLPDSYDANAHCEYHGGVEGHSIERCITIKRAVQDLMDSGELNLG